MTTVQKNNSSVRSNASTAPKSTSSSAKSAGTDKPTPGQNYKIKSGDTLSKIAQQAFGDASRWPEIAAANPGKVGANALIKAGDTIQIPGASKADQLQNSPMPRPQQKVIGNVTQPAAKDSAPDVAPTTGDPALQQDLQAQLQQAHQGGPTTKVARSKSEKKTVEAKSEKSLGSAKRSYSRSGGWLDEKKDVADEASKDKKVSKDWSANATLASVGVKDNAAVWKAGDMNGAGVDIAGGAINAKGEVHALHVAGEGTASVGFDIKKKNFKADLSGKVEAHLVGVEGSLATPQYGNNVIHGKTTVKGKAYVGAEATGNVTFNAGKDGVKLGAGVDAFAGAKASAEINQSVGFAGEDIGSVGAKGEVYAGIGVKAKGDVGFEKGKFKASVELGAALGVGAGVKLNVEVDVVGTAKAVAKTAVAVADGIASGANYVGGKMADGAAAVGGAAKSAWNKATSFFW